jgi:hypothetical protein
MYHDRTAWFYAFFVGKKYGCSKGYPQRNAADMGIVVNPLALSVPTVILDMLKQSHIKLNLSPRILFRVQKAVILNTCFIVRILLNNEDHLTDDQAENF